jgi:hypothetical protein
MVPLGDQRFEPQAGWPPVGKTLCRTIEIGRRQLADAIE